ncbi:hypothetical protein ATI61_103523 [Archangium gephyra]|uniref:Lipoprotein n=1 Tax=Archangium gephyra TaxID=48 RepID=A0ABX9K707_9BACT|nr:hypothetical protein ATI61_103523 [Archangium gephyra]
MKLTFAAVAAGFCIWVAGCGPASGDAKERGTETIRQELTPCLSACWGGCTIKNLECREGCEQQCNGDNGCDVCTNACFGDPYNTLCYDCQNDNACVWPTP